MKIQEELISFIIYSVLQSNKKEFVFLKRNVSELEKISPPFDRITYEKAINKLQNADFKIVEDDSSRKIEYGDDLNIESERHLTINSSKPLFVIGYPLKIKPFYVKEDISIPEIGIAV